VKKYYPLFAIIFLFWWLGPGNNANVPVDSRPTATPSPYSEPASPAAPYVTQIPQVSESPSISSTPEPSAGESPALLAAQSLVERGRSSTTNYSRDAFGSDWKDVDRNGCDTRNDILGRDFTTASYKVGTNDCKVIGGTWTDPYSNESYTFTKQPSEAQIDHVVALSNAWQMGADLWTDEMRTEFANDPLNLIVTVASLNRQKSDSNAASWLPPYRPGRCDFIARQVAVKTKWQLFVTSSEKSAMLGILSKPECSQTVLPN
jgi:hypothetical protein